MLYFLRLCFNFFAVPADIIKQQVGYLCISKTLLLKGQLLHIL